MNLWGVTGNALYLWAWSLDTNLSNSKDCPTNGTWEASNETNRLTYNAQNDTYSISFSPVTFFNRNGLGRIGFLLKAKNGSGDKKSQDITIDVGIFQLTLSEPTENTIVINQGQILNISATTTMPANFELIANDPAYIRFQNPPLLITPTPLLKIPISRLIPHMIPKPLHVYSKQS